MKNIRFIRKEMGITQIELAQLTNIPRYKIQLHESGTQFLSQSELEAIFDLWTLFKKRHQFIKYRPVPDVRIEETAQLELQLDEEDCDGN